MVSGVLSCGAEEQQQDNAGLGVDTDSHDLIQQQKAPPELVPPDHVTPKDGETKRSRSLEALVLQEFQDVVLKMTKRTRVCYRDAFFRLAESSRAKAKCTANGTPPYSSSVVSTAGGCPEQETNAIDRTVADLTMTPPRPVPLEVLVSRAAAAPETQLSATTSTTWTTTAYKGTDG